MPFLLSQEQFDEMVAHALAEVPNECCGILAGTGDTVSRVFKVANAEASPTRYAMAPAELYSTLKKIDSEGIEVVGFYHSHTHTEAYPSATDKKLAFWPDNRYVILSLMDRTLPVARAFRIVEGAVTEEALVVKKAAGAGSTASEAAKKRKTP